MGKVIVKVERCKGCGYCIGACSNGNLFIDGKSRNSSGYSIAAFNDEEDCSGCALCAEICPDVALEVFR